MICWHNGSSVRIFNAANTKIRHCARSLWQFHPPLRFFSITSLTLLVFFLIFEMDVFKEPLSMTGLSVFFSSSTLATCLLKSSYLITFHCPDNTWCKYSVTMYKFHRLRYSNFYSGLGRPLGLEELEASRIFRRSAHEGDKVFSPTHRPPLPPRILPWYSFLLEAVSTPGP